MGFLDEKHLKQMAAVIARFDTVQRIRIKKLDSGTASTSAEIWYRALKLSFTGTPPNPQKHQGIGIDRLGIDVRNSIYDSRTLVSHTEFVSPEPIANLDASKCMGIRHKILDLMFVDPYALNIMFKLNQST